MNSVYPSRSTGAPLALSNSWPLFDQGAKFDLGLILNSAVTDLLEPAAVGELGVHHSGCWECDLTAADSLSWSGGVYDIYGLQRGITVTRDEAIGFYTEQSRAALDQLRSYAIRHRRGFTLDVEIRAAVGELRRMRIIAAPICRDGRAIRLHGLKLIV